MWRVIKGFQIACNLAGRGDQSSRKVGTVVLGQYSLGTVVLGQCSLGTVVLGQCSLGTMVLGQ